jgi:glycogen debranching enzyme
LNHVSGDCEWLRESVDHTYNVTSTPFELAHPHQTINSPHLFPAALFDAALTDLPAALMSDGLTDIKSLSDVEDVMTKAFCPPLPPPFSPHLHEQIRTHVIAPLRLWEFYVIDVSATANEILAALFNPSSTGSWDPPPASDHDRRNRLALAITGGFNGSRFPFRVDAGAARRAYVGEMWGAARLKALLTEDLNSLNSAHYAAYDSDVETIISSMRGTLRWERIDPAGPRLGPLVVGEPLTAPYFTRFQLADGRTVAAANNGFIFSADPRVDFASPQSRS